MPIKKIVSPTTGIYQRVRETNTPNADGSIDFAAMRDLMNGFTKAHNHHHEHALDDVEQSCQQILKSDNPGGHIVGSKPLDVRCRQAFVKDVESAKWCCQSIRHMLAKGDVMGAINEAISLGRLVERSFIRAHEHNAAAGGKVREGGRKAAAITNPPQSEVSDRNKRIADRCQILRQENPHAKQAEIDRLVGKEFNRSARSVRQARSKSN